MPEPSTRARTTVVTRTSLTAASEDRPRRRPPAASNLQAHPDCVLAAGANQFRAGLDVVVEGPAVLVTDPARLQRLAAVWKSKLDWDFKVTDGGFRDPAGRLGLVFGVTAAKVLAFGKNPYSQTRYRFTGAGAT
jgi:hypothetical protein